MSLKNKFSLALAATGFSLSMAMAQAAILNDDIVVSTDGPATIIKFPESETYTNGFRIVCPIDPLYDPERARNKAAVFLFNHARDELESGYRDGVNFDEGTPTTTTTGLIGANNRLYLSYTYRQAAENKGLFLRENPDTLPGSNPEDPALIRALQKHAQDFCFSHY